ncbi:MAG: HAD family hydrolase [Acidimicrobiia bacterium]
MSELAVVAVGLDGDDTLWHSETHFHAAQDRYRALVGRWSDLDRADLDRRLLEVERANLEIFGYGVKAFTLSLVETAVEVSGGRIPGSAIREVLDLGKELLRHPVELLDGAEAAVDALAGRVRLVVVTKGDLLHQEAKVARSGLADRFDAVEVVAEKDDATYRRVLARQGVDPSGFVMVGNSVASDVLPVLSAGGRAVHVPYHLRWELDHAEADAAEHGFGVLESLHELPAHLEAMR